MRLDIGIIIFSPHLLISGVWDHYKMAAILQTTIPNMFSWLKVVVFWFTFQWNWTNWQSDNTGLSNSLALNRRQAITSASIDQIYVVILRHWATMSEMYWSDPFVTFTEAVVCVPAPYASPRRKFAMWTSTFKAVASIVYLAFNKRGCSFLSSIKWVEFMHLGGGYYSVPLISQFFSIVKTMVTYWITRSYLTGVTAAELRWHLPNMKVINRMKRLFLQIQKLTNAEL